MTLVEVCIWVSAWGSGKPVSLQNQFEDCKLCSLCLDMKLNTFHQGNETVHQIPMCVQNGIIGTDCVCELGN